MGIVESGIAMIVALFFYVRYRMSSYELAVERREKMIVDVNKILADQQMSEHAKSVALYMFNKSLVSGHAPKMFIHAAWHILIGSKEPKSAFTPHERSSLRHLYFVHLLPINALAGIHWFVLAFVLAVIAFFFAGIAHLTRLETIKSALAVKLIDEYRTSKLAT